jgi:hypothetical protein
LYNQKLLITELISQRVVDYFVKEFLDLLKILNAIVENTKESVIEELYVIDVGLK